MNVNVNLAFLSLSILYIAFLNVIFLKKGHIKTFELDTFGKLITLNLIGILLEFGCIFTIKYSSSEILIEIVNRLFLSSMPEEGWEKAPISRFSCTVICKKTWRPSGTWARPMPTSLWAGTPCRSFP